MARGQPLDAASRQADLDLPLTDEPADAPHQLDVMLVEPWQLAVVLPVAGHVVALGERGGDVDRAGDRLGRTRRPAGGGDHVARPHEGLRRDAPPVGALATDQLALDEDDRQTVVAAPTGGGLAGRPAPDHDHVELLAFIDRGQSPRRHQP